MQVQVCMQVPRAYLSHFLAIRLGVEWALSQQHGVLLGRHAQLVEEGVVPDLLHVVPVRHDAALDRVLESQSVALRLCLVAHVRVLVAHANQLHASARTAYNRREPDSEYTQNISKKYIKKYLSFIGLFFNN